MDRVKETVLIQRCQRQKSTLKNEVSMKFMLYCKNDPRDVGIEDEDGNWDYDKFREHIKTCPECVRFNDLLSPAVLKNLGRIFS